MDNTKWDERVTLNAPRLDDKNFFTQIIRFGMFAEQFPVCFNSNLFAGKINVLINNVSCSKRQVITKNSTEPTILSTRKDEITRRILSLPNPEAYLRLAKFMNENWNDIQKICRE